MAKTFPKGKKRSFRKKTSSKKAPTKNFVKAVQAIIKKDVETKTIYTQQYNTFFNSGINSSADCLQLISTMGNGTADASRIGDQVRALRLRCKGFLMTRFTGSAGTTYYQNCRIGVRLMVVQPKMYSSLGAIQANATTWLPTLLKKGLTTTAFTGIVPDLMADINRDAITVYHDKVFYVQNPYSNAVLGSAGNNLLIPLETCKFFNLSMKLNSKVLRYDSSIDSGLTPTNFNPVVLLGYCYLDGSSPDSVTTQISMSYDSYLDYEDA